MVIISAVPHIFHVDIKVIQMNIASILSYLKKRISQPATYIAVTCASIRTDTESILAPTPTPRQNIGTYW